MANKLHEFYSGTFHAKFQEVLPAYFCCEVISQEVHLICQLTTEFTELCLLQFNVVFSKFFKQEINVNIPQTQGSTRVVQKLVDVNWY